MHFSLSLNQQLLKCAIYKNMTTQKKPLILILIYKTTINKNNLKQLVIF